jgi:hypothetical protein
VFCVLYFVFCILYFVFCILLCCGGLCIHVIVPVATACHRCLVHARNERVCIEPLSIKWSCVSDRMEDA